MNRPPRKLAEAPRETKTKEKPKINASELSTTRERTHATVKRILKETGLTPAAHLTCVAATREEIDGIVRGYYGAGVRHIVALRGDPPGGAGDRYRPHPGGYANAAELTAGIKRIAPDIEVSVSAYPEKHPDSPTADADIDMLKRKVDAGADFVTTQLFFDNSLYYRFVEQCRARDINVPIIPGIMPVLSLKQIKRFTEMCGATLPPKLVTRLEAAAENPDVVEIIGLDWALTQIRGLLANGAPGYHLYIMNRAKSALALAAGLAA